MLIYLTFKRQIYNELWILTIAAPPINYTRIFFPNSFKMSREWVKPKKKIKRRDLIHEISDKKKKYDEGGCGCKMLLQRESAVLLCMQRTQQMQLHSTASFHMNSPVY